MCPHIQPDGAEEWHSYSSEHREGRVWWEAMKEGWAMFDFKVIVIRLTGNVY